MSAKKAEPERKKEAKTKEQQKGSVNWKERLENNVVWFALGLIAIGCGTCWYVPFLPRVG